MNRCPHNTAHPTDGSIISSHYGGPWEGQDLCGRAELLTSSPPTGPTGGHWHVLFSWRSQRWRSPFTRCHPDVLEALRRVLKDHSVKGLTQPQCHRNSERQRTRDLNKWHFYCVKKDSTWMKIWINSVIMLYLQEYYFPELLSLSNYASLHIIKTFWSQSIFKQSNCNYTAH